MGTLLLRKMWVAVLQNPHLGCLFTLMVLQLPKLNTGHLEVLGPSQPILALVGEDSELPCHLSPSVSAEQMELRWFRNTFSPAVLVYHEGRELKEEQMPEYRGRAMLVQDNITLGQVALKIHQVRTSDEGVYGCSFRDKQAHGEAFVSLKVAAMGSDPHISMKIKENGEMELECTSSGWYPEPQVLWRTANRKKLQSISESRNRDEEGLFTVAASVIITDSSIESVSCCIQNLLLGQEKEVEISVPEWRLARLHAVGVTLDENTAHPHLVVSNDSKSIYLADSRQTLPDTPERFDTWPCVLGRETFNTGRHYWEVEVAGRTDWLVGVCREDVLKKGFILMSPRNGFWVMELSQEEYWALKPPRVLLSLPEAPGQIGIFLDYNLGIVSFYNTSNESHIYTFQEGPFSGPVRPLFCLWSCGGSPLTIRPVAAQSEAP
ncbi:butyrophilin subfamily 1 member A1-like isoform X2 [Peromyscus leucopus]|uniref:butyrophilin subfamily 1 member A1-like isoform X2 n=1 Tax=Peromyscus leucopus TaxID=10041 RepID=UPI0010A1EEB9|nr:butyrophilin subfamily 1 member A1-like isoform X2 [Peromyscus leucopus]